MTPFQLAIKFTLEKEGGYVNDPNDSGGETNYGISKRSHPDVDIKNLSVAGAMEIYKREYWDHYKLDSFAVPLCVAMFDAYVQHNPKQVVKFKERAKDNWKEFNAARREFYLALVTKNPDKYGRYKKGWLNRMNDLDKYCQIVMQQQQ